MIFQLQDLNKITVSSLPEHCRRCGWWQGYDAGWPGEREVAAWAETAEETFGSWGKLALGDNRLLGMIQFGPPSLFARAAKLPCGPAAAGSVLLTCGAVAEDALVSIRKSLVTAVLVELKHRGVETVEAYSMEDAAAGGSCHFFPPDFLRDCGFYPVRTAKGLKLMRLELGGALPAEPRRKPRRGLLERIKRTSPAPAPVAMAETLPLRPPATACSQDG